MTFLPSSFLETGNGLLMLIICIDVNAMQKSIDYVPDRDVRFI